MTRKLVLLFLLFRYKFYCSDILLDSFKEKTYYYYFDWKKNIVMVIYYSNFHFVVSIMLLRLVDLLFDVEHPSYPHYKKWDITTST